MIECKNEKWVDTMKVEPNKEKDFYKCVDKICDLVAVSRNYFLERAANNYNSP